VGFAAVDAVGNQRYGINFYHIDIVASKLQRGRSEKGRFLFI